MKKEPFQPKAKILSYVRRQGRMTKAQKDALETFWQDHGIDFSAGYLNFPQLFGNHYPTIVEIGFGMGEALLQFAENHPQKNFIGVDVHRPGVGAVLKGIHDHDLKNIKVFCADALDVLQQKIPDQSLEGVHLFFPDPWPKRRHHKRRLVNPAFAELIRGKLKRGGYLHMATDWQDYAEQMLKVMSEAYGFINTAGHGRYAERPATRPLTKFEARGEMKGHPVWDLIFLREV